MARSVSMCQSFVHEVWTVLKCLRKGRFCLARPELTTQLSCYQHKSPLDDGEIISLFTFLAGRTKEQVLDKEIRQKSTKKSELDRCLQCLLSGSPKRDPLDSEKMACLPKLEYVSRDNAAKRCIHVLPFTVGK